MVSCLKILIGYLLDPGLPGAAYGRGWLWGGFGCVNARQVPWLLSAPKFGGYRGRLSSGAMSTLCAQKPEDYFSV